MAYKSTQMKEWLKNTSKVTVVEKIVNAVLPNIATLFKIELLENAGNANFLPTDHYSLQYIMVTKYNDNGN